MIKSEPNLLVTHAGRARKVPKKGLPPNFDKMTWAEQKRFLHLQDAAHQYKKMKIVKEIEKQVNDGGDRCETTAAVLNLAIVQYRNAGQETPWDLMEEIRLAALVPSLLALEYSKDPPTMNSAIRGSKGVFEVKAFRPSAVAHSRPLQGFEVGAFEATLASKVHVLGAVPIDGSMKKTNAEVLMQAIPNSVQADGTSTHRVQKAPSGKGAAGARRTAPYIVGDPSDNTVKNSSLPKPPKRKQCRKNKSTAPPQYLPSTAAHTWPDHSYRTATESANQPNSGKRKRSPKNNLIAPPQYRPSTTAHTWPVHSYKIVTQTAEKPNLGKRKHRRKKNSDAPPELTSLSTQPETVEGDADRPAGRYLPSTAAHTWPVTADGLTTERALPLKRKPKSAEPPQNKRQKKVSWKKAQSGQCGGNVYTPTPSPRSSQRLENQTYEQQLGNLFRPTTGCYVGKVVRLDQPGKRGAKRKSRLAVFKSPGIQRLACSLTQTDMTSADTRALEQNPAAHIEVTARHVTTTDAVDIHIPNTAGPPLEVSFPCATAQAVSLPPRESLNGIVKQVQSESFSAQYGAMSQEQNDTAHISSSPKSLDAEQRIGAKRKRSITDEAGREGTRPPTLTATSMVRPSAFGNAPIATGQSEPSEIGQVASTFTDVEAIQPREKAPIPAPTGELIASPSGASPSRHAPVDLGPSENRFSQPRDDNVQSNDDRGSLDLDERTSDEPTRPDNVDEVREQQAPNPCALEPLAFINTSPSTSSNIDSRSLPEDPVSADHGDLNRSHEDAALPTGLAAGNSPVDNEKSLQPRLLDWATDTREESVAGTDSLDQLRQDLPTATSEASQPQAGVENPVEHKMRKGVLKMRPQGGSIAAQRRRIVMDIIDSCGGIYPGVAELGPPFKERWAESGYPGKAETSTLNGVVKYLCDIGKLRRVTSYCQDSRGVRFTKIMITKTDIHTTDPRIFAMRKKVESKHPVWYFPDEVEISDKVRDTYWDREGPLKNRTTKDLEVDEDKVQLQHMPDYIGRYELKEKAREKRKAQKERQAAVMHELIAEGNNSNDDGTPDGSTLGVVDTPQKRRRLLNVAKRSGVTKPQRKVNRLATLNKAPTRIHDFSQAAVQDDASKGLERWHNVRLPYPRNSLTFARMLGVDDFQRDFESQELEEQLHEEAIERIIATDAAEGITYGPFLPPSSSRFETLTLKLSGNGQLISDSKREPPKTVKRSKSLYPDRHSRAARQQMFTVMEPEHIFHPATGTFSINFSACRTPDQIRRRYHWQNQPIKPFHDLIDDTQQWELCEQGLEDAKFGDWTFINYTLPHHHQTTGASPRYWERLWPCKGHRPRDDNEFPGQPPAQETPDQQLLADLAAAESQASPASNHSTRASLSSHTSIAPSPITDIQTPVVPTKRKRGGWNDTPLKTRRLTTVHKPSQHPQHHPPGKLLEEPGLDQRRRSAPRIRRGQKLAADFTQRILTAVTVIRTLTGGVDSNIDWVLVTRVFEPEYDQVYIQGTWPKVLQKHRVQAEMIRVGFQQMFLKAYEKGLVPPLDYDNLEAYNWSWLINWTIEHLDIPIEAAPDLPLQRDEIDQVFDLEVGEDPGMSTYYEFGTGSARIGRREAELHKRAWIQPLVKERQERSIVNGSDLAVVRTWVRANAATKEKVYDSQSAADKLVQVDEKVRDRVTHELLREGVTMNLNKGRPMPGGQYALSQTYLKPLKKRIEAGHLRRAAMFKREVDKSLDDNGEMIIPQISDDALTLVVQNMQAHRRVSFIATNPPMEKFGLGGIGNYRGRQIPKSKYRFDVGLQATDNYREGNPLLPLPKPPRASRSEADKEKIPLWYDIHGDVNWQLWEMAVAAVMSILAMRPSVSIYEVEPPLRPTLGLWEVQMLLDWMVEAGAAQKMGDSYMVAEWWWLCLDSGRTLEEDKKLREDEQRLKLQEKPRTDTEARETAWDETNQGGCWDALGRKDQEDVQMEDV